MTFDLRTIYAMTALACLVLGLLQAVVFMSGRFDRWLAWWSLSNIVLGLGNLCIGLRGYASDFLTIQCGNLLVIAGCALMPAAMRMFAGRPVDFVRCGFLVLLLDLPMLLAFPDAESARQRVIYGSLLSCLLDLAVAYEAARVARDENLYTARLTAGLFLTTAVLYLVRAASGTAGLFGNGGLFEGGSSNHALLGLLAMVFLALRGMLIVLMAAERSANQLREAAHHDPLTGVLNRGGLLSALGQGARLPMAALLIDLDHFKQLNDSGGHALGDRILCLFADCAQAAVGRDGFVARHGGDEFVILLRGGSLAEAVALGERLRTDFGHSIQASGVVSDIRPTLSIGVSAGIEESEGLDALLQRADHALYRVKRRGRDGVEAYDGQPEWQGPGTNPTERIKNIVKNEATSAELTPLSSPPRAVGLS
jgi:diguanylate cyclase (GGDEF)-like protein